MWQHVNAILHKMNERDGFNKKKLNCWVDQLKSLSKKKKNVNKMRENIERKK